MSEKSEDSGLETLMDALEVFFHMATCPDHTPVERGEAFQLARKSFIAFAYDGEDPEAGDDDNDEKPVTVLSADDPAQNAPTSGKVH